jgi:hypothetical protein
MSRDQVTWWMWAIGTALVVLSWVDVVSTTVGWCGFVIGLAGSAASWGVRPPSGEAQPPTEAVEDPHRGNDEA